MKRPRCAYCGEELKRSQSTIISTNAELPGRPRVGWHVDCQENPLLNEALLDAETIEAIARHGHARVCASPNWWKQAHLADAVPGLLVEGQAAYLLKITAQRLKKLREQGHGPAFVKICSRIRYRREDVTAWALSLRGGVKKEHQRAEAARGLAALDMIRERRECGGCGEEP